jgi:hypothetical protein
MPIDDYDLTWGYHRLPDNLVGIGGAGKSVVDRFLSNDWIINEAVGADKLEGDPFRAYIIDTETDERADGESRVAEHNDRVKRTAEEFGANPTLLSIDIQYLNLITDTPDALLSTAGAAAEEVGEDREINSWWLQDDEISLNKKRGIETTGRRAVGKALLQANKRSDGEIVQFLEQIASTDLSTTTIVAGLGEATGSGMAIEFAKQIRTVCQSQVSLVGILPAVAESKESLANAFAALSELEYLAVTDHNPFRNIILLPNKPANDLEYNSSFLDGIVKTIIARENLAKGSRFDESSYIGNTKTYAPFTFATPQTLRYNIGEIKRQERAVREYCDAKRSALKAELELYEALHNYFTEEWGGDIGQLLEQPQASASIDDDQFALSSTEVESLWTRLNDLRSWIEDEERFGSVYDEALITWRNRLGQWIAEERQAHNDLSYKEGKTQLFTHLPERIESLRPVKDVYVSEPSEQKLASVIRDELRAIGHRATLLRVCSLLESTEPEVGAVLAAAMDPEGNALDAGKRLDAVIKEARHQLDQRQANRETLDELKSELAEERDELARSWRDTVVDDMEGLIALATNVNKIRTRLEIAEAEIERTLQEIEAATTPESISRTRVSVDFDRLNDRLRTAGLAPVDAGTIERSVQNAAGAFEAWHEYNRDSILDILPIRDRVSEAEERYLSRINDIDDRFVQVSPTNGDDLEQEFHSQSSVPEQFDAVREELREERMRRHKRISNELETMLVEWDLSEVADPYRDRWEGEDFDIELPDIPDDVTDRIETAMANGFNPRSAEAALNSLLAAQSGAGSGGVVRSILDEALIGPVERRQERLDREAARVERELEQYDRLREIVTTLGGAFDGTGPAHPAVSDPSPMRLNPDDPYVTKIAADDMLSLHQYRDIGEADILYERSLESESQKVERHFCQGVEKKVVQNHDISGRSQNLHKTVTGFDEKRVDADNSGYDGHTVVNVFLSRAFPDDVYNSDGPVCTGVREVLEDSGFLSGGPSNYHHESFEFGGPWDLSLVTFVSGAILDNIQGIKQYKQAYDEQQTELGDAIRVRHTHGLDGRDSQLGDGGQSGFVYRDSLLDLDDPDDVYTLLDSSEDEMVDLLLDQYLKRTIVPGSTST